MKNVFLLSLSILMANSLFAQTVKIIEPEFSGIVVFVNDTIGEGIRLEQQTASTKVKSNGATFVPVVNLAAGKTKSQNVIKGCCSPVKIDHTTKIRFIIKVTDNSIDPVTVVNIFKLVKDKDCRTIELGSATALGGAKGGEINFLPFKGKKYGQSSYLIELESLEIGEYALTLANRRDIFNLFSVF